MRVHGDASLNQCRVHLCQSSIKRIRAMQKIALQLMYQAKAEATAQFYKAVLQKIVPHSLEVVLARIFPFLHNRSL